MLCLNLPGAANAFLVLSGVKLPISRFPCDPFRLCSLCLHNIQIASISRSSTMAANVSTNAITKLSEYRL